LGTRRRGVFEQLEPRCLLTMVPVTVDVTRFIQVDNPDGGIEGDGDYYAQIFIDGQAHVINGTNPTTGTDFTPNWTATQMVDDSEDVIPGVIQVYDADGLFGGPRDQMDVSPKAGTRSLNLLLDLTTGMFTGDIPFGKDFTNQGFFCQGDAGPRGKIFFTV